MGLTEGADATSGVKILFPLSNGKDAARKEVIDMDPVEIDIEFAAGTAHILDLKT